MGNTLLNGFADATSNLQIGIVSTYDAFNPLSERPSSIPSSSLSLTFDDWVVLHGKTYSNSTERRKRSEIYETNVIRWNTLNQLGDGTGAKFGSEFEPFSDLTPDEFAVRMGNMVCHQNHHQMDINEGGGSLEYDRIPSFAMNDEGILSTSVDWESSMRYHSGITYIDWRNHNGLSYVTPPKNQGQHGTCWSFAAAENLEGLNVRQGFELANISEQEFISCCPECQGRTQEVTFEWLVQTTNGRPALEDSYPYDGNANITCRAQTALRANVTLHYWDRIRDEDGTGMSILEGLTTKGPMSMGCDARCFFGYQSGIIRNCSHVPDGAGERNHAVSLVAAGADFFAASIPTLGENEDDESVHLEVVDYFTIKNSWGSSWGEGGYVRIEQGSNQWWGDWDVIYTD